MGESNHWWSNVSAGTVAGVLAVAIVASAAAIWPPARKLLTSDLNLPVWALLSIVVGTLGAGILLGWKLWRRSPVVTIVQPPPTVVLEECDPEPYEPSYLEDQVLRVLRLADDESLSARHLNTFMIPGTAVGDVALAASRLLERGFITDYLQIGVGQLFRLDERGIEYAQKMEYPPGDFEMKKRIARLRGR